MKILGGITIVLTLALASAFCSQATAAPASELLQKGLYAEEVEGNIDSAIKTYGEVIKKTDAPRNQIAQALYRQGMCYLKVKDEQAAKTALEKLVNEYTDQTEIVQKAQLTLDDLMDFDPAALMPPGTLIYVELGSPGKQVETILNMLKGTPYENPLAAIGNQNAANPNQKSAGDIVGALLNPSMMAEFKKIRGSAIGITGVAQNNPPMIAVLYPGKSDALRGLIMAGLNMAGAPGEPIEGMQTINIQNAAEVAYDDKVILIAQPAEQIKWSVRQYKGLANEPTLASSNASFAKINKKTRHDNLLTAWINVDEVYTKSLPLFEKGNILKQVYLIDAIADFNHIDYLTMTNSIEQDGFNDTTEIVFKDGHHCLAYDLIRTPNISKAALSAVPSNAVAIATFALSADNENQAGAIRGQIKNVTGLDIGREIFANIEQVTVFAVPAKTPNAFLPGTIGLAITSHNPQQTRQILAKTIGTADSMFTGRPVADANSFGGKYQVGQIQNNPMYCYVEQAGKVTILSLNPDITQASVAAIKDHNSVCNAGPLSDAVAKMPAIASKMILLNAGGAIRLAAPTIIEYIGKESRDSLQNNFEQLALACDKSVIELRTDEQPNSFTLNRKLTGLPPLNQLFGPVGQIVQTIKQAKTEAVAEAARRQAGITIKQAPVAPVIDGVADAAWSAADKIKLTNVHYTPPSSPNDLSANFKTMWDQNNLYLFIDVTDDVLKNDAVEAYENDSIEVYIDATNSKAASYGPTDYQYIFVWDKTSPKMQETKQNRTEGVQYAMVTTNTGYQLEIKFPWSTLGTKPHTGAKIGLDVHVNDNDSGGKRKTKLTWHSVPDNAWQNPQLFGNAELGGLLGWWKLDEKDGTTAADSSGNGNDGTLVGNPQWRPQAGKIGGAIELGGHGDYVKIANESAFNITSQITVAAWVNITSVPQEWTGIVTKGDTAWRLSTSFASNVFHFGLSRDDYLNGSATVGSGQWHHVACVYDGSKISIYVDGKLDVSRPQSGPIATNNFPVCIGENIELTGHCWNGLIDDVRVYTYALSDNEVVALATGK
jgi:Carbohydrate family 9 binding domain-like/Concanavalin A-like lectin/glucanases superfamily/Tetratricopeptide repeat